MDPTILSVLLPLLGAVALPFLLLRLLKLRNQYSHHHLQRHASLPPGPWPLPIIGNLHMLGRLPHRALHDLAKKYGPIMSLRLGTVQAVVVSSPEVARIVLKTHANVFSGRAKVQVAEYFSYGNKDMAFAPYDSYWRSIKKMSATHLLSLAKVESFRPMRREEVRQLVMKIKEAAAAHEVVNVSVEVGNLTGDMGCRMILGCTPTERANLKSVIRETMKLAGAFNVADYVPFLAPFDLQGLTKRMKVVQKALDAVLEDVINENRPNLAPENRGNFVDVLLSMDNKLVNSDGEVLCIMEKENIKAIILDMIIASYDTSSTMIEWGLSELIRNPHIMARLQEELQAVVGMDRMVEENDLPNLSYLEMVVKEAFRLHPAGPLLIPHESVKDTTINGYHIPEKSRMFINIWAIGRDPKVWSDNADEFFPERFIGSDIDFKEHNFQLIPFGAGRRACPGMLLGLRNVRLILAQLVHCFNWELPDGKSPEDLDMKEEFGLSLPRENNLLLKPTYRLHT